MSAAMEPVPVSSSKLSRGGVVAVAAAGVALVLAVVAAIVVLRRSDSDSSTRASQRFLDVSADAEAVVALLDHDDISADAPGATLAALSTIGLTSSDHVASFDGAPTATVREFFRAVRRASGLGRSAFILEIDRDGRSMVVRVAVRGDLKAALAARDQRQPTSLGSAAPNIGSATPNRPVDPDGTLSIMISRADVDAVLANPMSGTQGLRVVPSMIAGAPDGFKLYAIRPDSFAAKLGFDNGDTVQRVNGVTLDSAERALEIYTTIRDADTFTVELTRRGQSRTHTITIR
jgi:hypothetical protein